MKFRNLKANEIECRIGRVIGKPPNITAITLLLYKNARCDMAILDEAVGVDKWQRNHYECKGNLFCSVSIQSESSGWITKSDCGTESNADKEKGESSDSFKRACVNWGIGRELYTAPFIYIPFKDNKGKENFNIKDGKVKDEFYVTKISTSENKSILGIAIRNRSIKTDDGLGKRVFVWSPEKMGKKDDNNC